MSTEPDRRVVDNPTMEDAEKACEALSEQVQRARQVLRDYRATLGPPGSTNDNRGNP